MINRSTIMKRAWATYRQGEQYTRYHGRARFAKCLEQSWEVYHREIRQAFYAA